MNPFLAAIARQILIGGALSATLFVVAKLTRFQIIPAGHEQRASLMLDRWTGQTWKLHYTAPIWQPLVKEVFQPDLYLESGTPANP